MRSAAAAALSARSSRAPASEKRRLAGRLRQNGPPGKSAADVAISSPLRWKC